jgi:hypothetical protein
MGNAQKLVAKDTFRHGIKNESDWIERLRHDPDPRIFYLLGHRYGRVVTTEKAKEYSDYVKKYPEYLNKLLTRWGVTEHESWVKKNIAEWTSKFGANAQHKVSPHYTFLFHKKDAQLLKKLPYYMEEIFKHYTKKFKIEEKITKSFLVKIYPSRQSFLTEADGLDWAFAFFSSSKRSLVGHTEEFTSPKKEKAYHLKLIKTFFHEGFHQFLSYHVPDPPIWINEGMAENFEAAVINGRRISENGNMNANDLERLKRHMKNHQTTPLKTFIYLSQKEFYENIDIHYPQAWGLIHFFGYGSRTYRKYYQEVIEHLKNGMGRKEALDQVFAKVKWEAMEKAFRSYILKLKTRSSKDKW